MTVIPIVVGALGKRIEGIEGQRKNRGHPDHSSVNIN